MRKARYVPVYILIIISYTLPSANAGVDENSAARRSRITEEALDSALADLTNYNLDIDTEDEGSDDEGEQEDAMQTAD